MRWALLLMALCVAGCTKETTPVRDAGQSALPFDPGPNPRIEDLKVDDLGAFVGGKAWCRDDSRIVFAQDGTWTRSEGGRTTSGAWRAEQDRLALTVDAGTRPMFVEAGKVNGRTVASLDGVLYAECP